MGMKSLYTQYNRSIIKIDALIIILWDFIIIIIFYKMEGNDFYTTKNSYLTFK